MAVPETSEEKWPRLLKQVEAMRKLQTGLLATVRKIEDPAVKNILYGEACRELDDILKSESKTAATKTLVKEGEASDNKKKEKRVKEEASSAMKTAPGARTKMINTNTRGVKLRPADQRSISSYFSKGEKVDINVCFLLLSNTI